MELDQIMEDDKYFASRLDFIPKRYLIPLSDEKREQIIEKMLKNKNNGKNKGNQESSSNPNTHKKKHAKRSFNGVKSNADVIEMVSKQQEEKEKKIAKEYLKTETLAPRPKKKIDKVSLDELRNRLVSKIEAERKKSGIPGARVERNKLLPQHRQQKLRKDDKDEQGDEKNPNQGHSKEEIEAKISYGALKLEREGRLSKEGSESESKKLSTKSIINVKKLIKKAEAEQARLEALKAEGKEDVVKHEKWEILERKAAGEKIKDNPKLLKKTLKTLEKKKVKSSQQWDERKKQEEDERKEREDSKNNNVIERKNKKIEKRGGVIKNAEQPQRKRQRPGFEGTSHRKRITNNEDSAKKQKPGEKIEN